MKQLPQQPETPNMRAMAQEYIEEQTGISTALVTLQHNVMTTVDGVALALVFKNGTLVRPSTYSVSGNVITLGSALIAGDWVVIVYSYRS